LDLGCATLPALRVTAVDSSPWLRHRALRLLADAWPELATGQPPSRATLASWLAGASALRAVAPAEAPASYELAAV
jgi:hypothetical protein